MNKYLITGGAGSLGLYILDELNKNGQDMTNVRVLDINECALANIKYPVKKLYGSITDYNRLLNAMINIDIVIHTAALKNLDITEYNTSELIKTNITGTDNVIQAAIKSEVKKVLFISSDKAVEPTSIYGASKLIGEHIILNYNSIQKGTILSIIRSGNFISSNGNVFEVWNRQHINGEPITVTNINCKRYFIKTNKLAKIIILVLNNMQGGEIYIPDEHNMTLYSIPELLKLSEIGEPSFVKITGLRKGEKLEEKLMTTNENSVKYFDQSTDCYIIK